MPLPVRTGGILCSEVACLELDRVVSSYCIAYDMWTSIVLVPCPPNVRIGLTGGCLVTSTEGDLLSLHHLIFCIHLFSLIHIRSTQMCSTAIWCIVLTFSLFYGPFCYL